MNMISLNFTLYRFVCDKVTFSNIFAVDAESRRFPENSPFYCCWAIVPRQRAVSTVKAAEWSGCTPASYFKSHGNEIVLPFNNAVGTVDIEGDTNVITFNVRPYSNSNEPISVVAKGTLDPRPYVGRSNRNYAIKLRDVSGQTIGKLLFALEAREESGCVISTPLGIDGQPGVHTGLSNNLLNAVGVGASAGNLALRNRNENGRNGYGTVDGGKVQYDKREPYAQRDNSSFSNSVTPQAGSLEGMPMQAFNCLRAPTSTSATTECDPHSYVKLDLCIERIVVKDDSSGQENPVPLLLGANYYLKVRFGGGVSTTQSVECQDPRKITYKDHMTFIEDVCSNDRLRFSLWENGKQVAGFSLNPTKFRVDIGMQKEYAIPFRYYPTRQSAFLELTVQRMGEPSLEDVEKTIDSFRVMRGIPFGGMRFMDEQLQLGRSEGESSEHLNTKTIGTTSGHSTTNLSSHTPEKAVEKGQRPEKLCREECGKQHTPLRAEHSSPPVAAEKKDFGQPGHHQTKAKNGDRHDTHTNPAVTQLAPSERVGENITNSVNSSFIVKQVSPVRKDSSAKRHALLRRMTEEEVVPASAMRQYPGNDAPTSMKTVVRSMETTRSASPLRVTGAPRGDQRPRKLEDEYQSLTGGSKLLSMEDASQPRRNSPSTSPDQRVPDNAIDRERLVDSLLHRMNGRPGMNTTLMEEWMEWRHTCLSSRSSRSGSEGSAFCREDSVASLEIRSHAVSPRPTKSLSHAADMRPYTPVITRRAASDGRPPIPGR